MVGTARRLLIVDDVPGVTGVIERAALQIGFEVLSIHDSDQFEEALQKLRPTITFIDIALSGRGGLELVELLAADDYRGRIVIMSGSDQYYLEEISNVAKSRGLVVAGTLGKPFRKQALLDLLTDQADSVGNEMEGMAN